jgi:hypothetical protein
VTLQEALAALLLSLGSQYPTRVAEVSNRPGRVTCVVWPSGGEFEESALCDPVPERVTAEVVVLSAATGARGVADLLTHKDPVASLIRAAGWEPLSWTSGAGDDQPTITFTAVHDGHG